MITQPNDEVTPRQRLRRGGALIGFALAGALTIGAATSAAAQVSSRSEGPVAESEDSSLPPTESEVRSAYEQGLTCMKEAGVVVTDSTIDFSYYDIRVEHSTSSSSGLTGPETREIEERCNAESYRLQEAWSNGKDMRDNEVSAAIDRCLEALPGDEPTAHEEAQCIKAGIAEVHGDK